MQVRVSKHTDHCKHPIHVRDLPPCHWGQCEAARLLAVKSCVSDRPLSYWDACSGNCTGNDVFDSLIFTRGLPVYSAGVSGLRLSVQRQNT